jgi:hypothetical protein
MVRIERRITGRGGPEARFAALAQRTELERLRYRVDNYADDVHDTVLSRYPGINPARMLTATESLLGWDHADMGRVLGRTPDQIRKYILHGLPYQSVELITPRIEAAFTAAVTVVEHIANPFARTSVFTRGQDRLDGLSIADLISIGQTRLALGLVGEGVDQTRRTMGQERGPEDPS